MLKPSELKDIERYLKNLKHSSVSHPYTKTLNVYTVAGEPFAYLETGKATLRLSLRSDPGLAKLLRERYEEVAPGQRLDPRKWNTIVISGQLGVDELKALIDHSYALAADKASPSK